jgi:APA family basic amino acid/polyamine antiporter
MAQFPPPWSTGSGSGPAVAIVLQAVWASVLIGVFGVFEQVVVYVGFAITIFSAATVAAVVVLRVRRPAMPQPFRMPACPWLATIYVATSLCIAAYTAVSRPGGDVSWTDNCGGRPADLLAHVEKTERR